MAESKIYIKDAHFYKLTKNIYILCYFVPELQVMGVESLDSTQAKY